MRQNCDLRDLVKQSRDPGPTLIHSVMRGINFVFHFLRRGKFSMTASSHDLYEFAIELRKLAYTMPGGHEDPLIRLSERIARHAQLAVAAESPPQRLSS